MNRAHSRQLFALLHMPKTAGRFFKASLRERDATGLIDMEIVLRMERLAEDGIARRDGALARALGYAA